ncbi:hypothetical protein JW992_01600 [candidate division KSB1 bacterium]|nr:hypothetical protein [candidate division KSB1 bacterium]
MLFSLQLRRCLFLMPYQSYRKSTVVRKIALNAGRQILNKAAIVFRATMPAFAQCGCAQIEPVTTDAAQ